MILFEHKLHNHHVCNKDIIRIVSVRPSILVNSKMQMEKQCITTTALTHEHYCAEAAKKNSWKKGNFQSEFHNPGPIIMLSQSDLLLLVVAYRTKTQKCLLQITNLQLKQYDILETVDGMYNRWKIQYNKYMKKTREFRLYNFWILFHFHYIYGIGIRNIIWLEL